MLRSLLSFVVQNDKAGEEWNRAQFEELQLLVRELKCYCLVLRLGNCLVVV